MAVNFGDPAVVNVSVHLPAPPLIKLVQVCPVLALTVTVPVGIPLTPATMNPTVTGWPYTDGLGLEESDKPEIACWTVCWSCAEADV